jgi:hypothetical protein
MNSVMPLTRACSIRLPTGCLAPFQIDDPGHALVALVVRGDVDQPLGVGDIGPLRPVQDHVLDRLAQVGSMSS